MALSLAYWATYTEGKVKLQRKSEAAVAANRVLSFSFDPELSFVRAAVQASMKDRSYKVEMQLDDGYGLLHSQCECALRLHECHHVAAALLFGYKNRSKTDVPAAWIKRPKSAKPKEIKSMEELYPPKNPAYCALGRPVADDDRALLHRELASLGRYIGLKWFLDKEPEASNASPIPFVEDLLVNPGYLTGGMTWLQTSMMIRDDVVRIIAERTTGQRENPLWAGLRKLRFTASNFGEIISAAKRRSMSASLRKKIMSPYNLETVSACTWGIVHEEKAVTVYKSFGADVQKTGLWMHPSGALGASPDGLVTKAPVTARIHHQSIKAMVAIPDILEVKCPFSAKEMTVIEAATNLDKFYLKCHNGMLFLKENHKYYHQIQGQLYLAGRRCCDLVVWTPKSTEVLRIVRDPCWEPNLKLLIDFYFNVFVPSF